MIISIGDISEYGRLILKIAYTYGSELFRRRNHSRPFSCADFSVEDKFSENRYAVFDILRNHGSHKLPKNWREYGLKMINFENSSKL